MDKEKVPEGVIDFDEETGRDPFSVPTYAQDIFRHLKEREASRRAVFNEGFKTIP